MTTTATTPAEGELLAPCPFCGWRCVLSLGSLDTPGSAWCQCSECGAEGPTEETQAEAIAAWNKRATPSPGKAPERKKLDDDLLATIREAAKTRAEGAITQDGRAVFINYGDSEQQMLDAAEMDCPHCGGSGHKDDASPGKAEAEREKS